MLCNFSYLCMCFCAYNQLTVCWHEWVVQVHSGNSLQTPLDRFLRFVCEIPTHGLSFCSFLLTVNTTDSTAMHHPTSLSPRVARYQHSLSVDIGLGFVGILAWFEQQLLHLTGRGNKSNEVVQKATSNLVYKGIIFYAANNVFSKRLSLILYFSLLYSELEQWQSQCFLLIFQVSPAENHQRKLEMTPDN